VTDNDLGWTNTATVREDHLTPGTLPTETEFAATSPEFAGARVIFSEDRFDEIS